MNNFLSLCFFFFLLHAVNIHFSESYVFLVLGIIAFSIDYILGKTNVLEDQVKTISDNVTEHISQKVENLSGSIAKSINDAGKIIDTQITMKSLCSNFSTHMVGIAICVKDIATRKGALGVTSEFIKIGSFLGIEGALLKGIVARFTRQAEQQQAIPHIVENSIEDMLPLVGTILAMSGHEITDMPIEKTIKRSAENVKSIKILTDHIRKTLEATGIVKTAHFDVIADLNEQIVSLKEDIFWLAEHLQTDPNIFNKESQYQRVTMIRIRVDALSSKLRSINIPEIRNNQIVVETNTILMKALDFLVQIEAIRAQRGIRPEPVGVNIWGNSHIGKTTLIPLIVRRVKEALKREHGEKFGNTSEWSQWDVQVRDEFDTGYVGQEITYCDDAFQLKDNTDHRMWITYISPQPVGTVQANLQQKGTPYRSLLCITTSNTIPRTSCTINTIEALWNRWPICAHVVDVTKGGFKKQFKPECEHLKFDIRHMRDFSDRQEDTYQHEADLDDLVQRIVDQMVINMDVYIAKMHITSHTQQNALDPIGEDENESVRFVATGNSEDEMSDSELDSTSYEEEMTLDQFPEGSSPRRLIQSIIDDRAGHHWLDRGTIHRSVKISEIETRGREYKKLLQQQMMAAINNEPLQSINQLGNWRFLLRRKHDKVKYLDAEVNDSPYDFIAALGIWEIQPEQLDEFTLRMGHQPVIKILGGYDTIYYWGAILDGGSILMVEYGNMQQDIERITDCFMKVWLRKFFSRETWENQNIFTIRSLSRYVTGVVLIPIPFFSIVAELSTMVAFMPYPMPYLLPRPYTHMTPFMLPHIFLGNQFGYLETTLQFIRENCVRVFLQTLEWVGLEVGPIWTEIANITGQVVLDFTIIAVISTLLWVVWKVIEKLFFAQPKENSQKYDDPTKGRKARNKVLKQTKLKKLRLNNGQTEYSFTEFDYVPIGENLNAYNVELIDYCLDNTQDEGSSKKFSFVKLETATVLGKQEDEQNEIRFERSEFVYARVADYVIDGINRKCLEMRFKICGAEHHIQETYSRYIETFKEFNFNDFEMDVSISNSGENYFVIVDFICTNSTMQGKVKYYVRKHFSQLKSMVDVLKELKIQTPTTIDEIVENSGEDSLALYKTLKTNHQVALQKIEDNFNENHVTIASHGIGHKDWIILNAHYAVEGVLIRFWRYHHRNETQSGYQICQVRKRDLKRDISFAKILTFKEAEEALIKKNYQFKFNKMNKMTDRFRDLEQYLASEEMWKRLCDNQFARIFLPKTELDTVGRMRFQGSRRYSIESTIVHRNYLEIYELQVVPAIVSQGDCGGIVLSMHNRYKNSLVGFHASNDAKVAYCSFITKEDLQQLPEIRENSIEDPWQKLIIPGAPTDLPKGDCVEFLGKYKGTTTPASSFSLKHWHKSPWSDQFEELLQPSPLDAYDPRIEANLPVNQLGRKSLLLTPNSDMCKRLPEMDKDILEKCVSMLGEELSSKIGSSLQFTPSDEEELLVQALNGHPSNQFVKTIETDKAAGLPWNDVKGCSKKKHFIDMDENTGFLSFNLEKGQLLKKRLLLKLAQAKKGERILSLSNSKLKDALIKISAVKEGKTRVFHTIPVDKILCDSALFGNFKEAYTKLFIAGNHAVGINPHSVKWKSMYEYMVQHPNYFDLDFRNYDKFLHKELMYGVFDIIRKCINDNAPDQWDTARSVLAQESIETCVVDYETVYRTERGNKSGEFLTTVVNCIANNILSLYCWIKTTDEIDLSTFRENVSVVTFGDDKIESVSDEYCERYNYLTCKKVLEDLGHTITPGNKDGEEIATTSIDQLQFLKRTFKEMEGLIVAPLLPRSLESPFVWTQTSFADTPIWRELIKEQLFEACIHGEEYYEIFRKKLQKCSDPILSVALADLLTLSFASAKLKYIKRYHE